MELRTITRRFLRFTMCLSVFFMVECQGVCPDRCLCHLSQQPRTVTCVSQGLQEVPENISDVVESLDLSSNMITEVRNDIDRLVDLQYLNLARNRLYSLPDSIGGLKNLRRLDLTNNNIDRVSFIASITKLPSLMVLYLSKNPLSTLNDLASDVLQALDVSYCEIKGVNNVSLLHLPTLTTLSLAGNPLKSIQNATNQKLKWLDVSNCLLNYLDPETFNGFPALEELRMADNPKLVYSTRYATLKHLNLKRLDVSRCNLDRPGLHGFPSLTHARLSRNTIRLLPDQIFAKNRQLTHLYLNSNGLEQLNVSTFEGLVKLQVLDLSANSLQDVHSLTFHENIDLRLLNLSYNALYRFPNLASAVTLLDISSNFIDSLERESLSNMPRIRNVNLSDNRLRSIPDSLTSSTLMSLNLSKNRLVQLGNKSLAELPELQRVDLSGNRLTEAMNPTVFRNNLRIMTIRLEDNPWRCDCKQLSVTFDYLIEPPAKTQKSTLICQSPSNVTGYSWENACFDVWDNSVRYNKDRTWGLVLISMLALVILSGTIVSIRHTMKMKRRALDQRRELERAEARERLRLLQRRNQRLEEELLERPQEPRIHPLELIGPPSYEEAIHMPRLARSLDTLDNISVENISLRVLGSVDNLRAKKRRTRRPRKRTQSEEDLSRRQERREERRRRERNDSTGNELEQTQNVNRRSVRRSSLARRSRRDSIPEEQTESSSSRSRPRPQTPSARKRRKRRTIGDGHSTDDEDSDMQIESNRSIPIRELRREPRSGYREPPSDRDP